MFYSSFVYEHIFSVFSSAELTVEWITGTTACVSACLLTRMLAVGTAGRRLVMFCMQRPAA